MFWIRLISFYQIALSRNSPFIQQIQTCFEHLHKENLSDQDTQEAQDEDKPYPKIVEDGRKSLNEILTETSQDNPNLDTDWLRTHYECIQMVSEDTSSITNIKKPIKLYNKSDINLWSKKLTTAKASEPEFLPELIAVIKRANFLFNGQILRDTQIISLLAFVKDPCSKGMLQQVRTGEGKTTIVSCLAAMKALRGKLIDVITSSEILAKRDVDEREGFYSMLGLSVGENSKKSNSILPNECYKKQIVYGNIANFQFDILRRDINGISGRGDRPLQAVIVDEVDNMYIDNSAHIARISSPMVGTIFLGPVYASIAFYQNETLRHIILKDGKYHYVDGLFEFENDKLVLLDKNGEAIQEESEEYNARVHTVYDRDYALRDVMRKALYQLLNNTNPEEEVHLPAYLSEFIDCQKESWIRSARQVKFLQEGANYIVDKEGDIDSKVIPVDFSNTGVILRSVHWSGGLHQMIQIDEGIKLKNEDGMNRFIFNLGYLLRYETIDGQTGTLGMKAEQALLKQIYGIQITIIPTFKHKIFTPENTLILTNKNEWQAAVEASIDQAIEKQQAVLLICKTMLEARTFHKSLSSKYEDKVKLYCKGDEKGVVDESIRCGEIIIATNLAGRGTDIKTDPELNAKGGLKVIVSFLASNDRVEQQALGRTARQGKPGCGQLIINQQEIIQALSINRERSSDINEVQKQRESEESLRLLKNSLYDFFVITQEDDLYKKFLELNNFLRGIENNEAKLDQLGENWSNKLKQVKNITLSVEATIKFREKVGKLGYTTTYNQTALYSLYEALSHQLGFKLSAEELQTIHLYLLAKGSSSSDELEQRSLPILQNQNDLDTLKLFADLFGRNIEIITNDQDDKIIITSKSRIAQIIPPITLSAFHSKYSPILYQSLRPIGQEYLCATINWSEVKNIKGTELFALAFKEVRSIFAEAAKPEAAKINKAIEELFTNEFEKFKGSTIDKYRNNTIITNPNHLAIQAIKNTETLQKDRQVIL